MLQTPSVVLDNVSFSFADGTPVFTGLNAAFSSGVTGIIGPNGLGKSVLMRLISGELIPSSGTISRPEPVAVLPQKLTLRSELTVAELLGARDVLDALDELSGGEASPERAAELLEVIGDDWDAQDAALAAIAASPVPALAGEPGILERTVRTLSGGEVMSLALAGLRRTQPLLTLLDEPSNNLDARARAALIESLAGWPGAVLMVSHDRELLRSADAIAELRPVRIRAGRADGVEVHQHGSWDDYLERGERERDAAQRALSGAVSEAANARRAAQANATATARRAAQGKKAAQSMPKILANTRKNSAEGSAGRSATAHAARNDAAREALDTAKEAVRRVDTIDIAMPGASVSAGTSVVDGTVPVPPEKALLDDGVPLSGDAHLVVRGPERIALRGPNGVGKSRLLQALLPSIRVPYGVLQQRTGAGTTSGEGWLGFRDEDSVLTNLVAAVPGLTAAAAREAAGRMRLRGARVEEPFGRLSGGERFRVDLARALAASPPPQLLILDEPTNDLDLDSVAELARALSGFPGAVIVVSHDEDFLSELGIARSWELVDAADALETTERPSPEGEALGE